jgi:hypothetical protein
MQIIRGSSVPFHSIYKHPRIKLIEYAAMMEAGHHVVGKHLKVSMGISIKASDQPGGSGAKMLVESRTFFARPSQSDLRLVAWGGLAAIVLRQMKPQSAEALELAIASAVSNDIYELSPTEAELLRKAPKERPASRHFVASVVWEERQELERIVQTAITFFSQSPGATFRYPAEVPDSDCVLTRAFLASPQEV